MKNNKKLIAGGILLLEIILIFIQIILLNRSFVRSFNADELYLYMGEENYESGAYVDHSFHDGIAVVTGPFELKKGIYTVNVNSTTNNTAYDCYTTMISEDDQSASSGIISCDKVTIYEDTADTSYLSHVNFGNNVRIVCAPEENADGFYVQVNSITVTYMKGLTILHEISKLLFFFILIDLVIFALKLKKDKATSFIQNNSGVILALSAIILTASWPLVSRSIYFGDDLWYHLRRLAYLADELKAGHFPVKIQSGWQNGYGYAAGVGYGDLLLYPSAILINLGYTLGFAYKFYICLTSILTALLSYKAFKVISGNAYIAISGSALFTLMGFRLHSIYTGATVGEFGAYSFLPLIALGLWNIYRNKKGSWITLAFGITLTLGCHVLSTFILAVIIPILCLILWEKTTKKEVLVSLFKALGLTLLLNLYFIVPLADYMINQPMRGDTNNSFLWSTALDTVTILFNKPDPDLITGGFAGIGIASILIIMIVSAMLLKGKFEKNTSVVARLLILTLLLLWMTTKSFPWYQLSVMCTPVYRFLANMQFAWHFLDAASLLISLLMVISLRELACEGSTNVSYLIMGIVVALTLVQCSLFYQEVIENSNPITAYDKARLPRGGQAEFSLPDIDENIPYSETTVLMSDDSSTGTIVKRSGSTIYADIDNPTGGSVKAEFPLWAYKGYKAKASGQKLEVTSSDKNKVTVEIPAAFSGEVNVFFSEPLLWRIAELISLCCAACCIVLLVKGKQ